MKQLYLTTLILLFALVAEAQDWKPFYANDEVHYTIEDSGVITNSLVVYYTRENGSDSLYYFNHELAACITCVDNENVLLKGTNFFGDSMIFNGDGLYHIKRKGNSDYTIDVNKVLGQSWMYDNDYTATVTKVTEEEILGETDSVRHIAISNGATFKLSKNHGIIEFPSKMPNKQNLLIGIQNRNLGERVPKLLDFFTYHPGDILEYSVGETQVSGYLVYADHLITRFEILEEAEIDLYTIRYKVKRIVVKKNYYIQRPERERTQYSDYHQDTSEFVIFSNYSSGVVEATINSSVNMSSEFLNWKHMAPYLYVDDNAYSKALLVKKENGKYYKFIGGGDYSGLNLYKRLDNSIEAEEWKEAVTDGYSSSYLEGVGMTFIGKHGWHGGYNIELLGARIGGEEYGELGNIQFNTSIETINNANVTIYPNPATNQVTIQLKGYQSGNTEVKIYSTSGQVVLAQQHNFTTGELTLNIQELPEGIYYVKVVSDDLTATKKLVVN